MSRFQKLEPKSAITQEDAVDHLNKLHVPGVGMDWDEVMILHLLKTRGPLNEEQLSELLFESAIEDEIHRLHRQGLLMLVTPATDTSEASYILVEQNPDPLDLRPWKSLNQERCAPC